MDDDIPSVVAPYAQDEDMHDNALRPLSLSEFTGQKLACDNLKIFIESAKTRGQALDHVLLYGPPGLGKTTLSQIVACELGVSFKASSGPLITKAGDLAAILTNLQKGDVLFIDEIHRMSPAVEEILYPAMEDFALDLVIGEGPAARTVRIDLQPFTLVGATTRAGLVSRPLRDRFGIPLRLEYYNHDDLIKIIMRASRLLSMNIAADAALEIAKRSRGTPRIAGRLLRRIRDFAIVSKTDYITQQVADNALNRLEVDLIGLDSNDRRYIMLLAEAFEGGPVGIETICAALSEAKDAVEDVIEPYLIQKGFLNRTPRGRMLTHLAWLHLGLKSPKSQQDLLL
ncbi:MAG: Holliday junction DNA helicase RuvB [Alphaproteobacteria bacterium]|jgi:Holliday junction DNA helicase RuvB